MEVIAELIVICSKRNDTFLLKFLKPKLRREESCIVLLVNMLFVHYI